MSDLIDTLFDPQLPLYEVELDDLVHLDVRRHQPRVLDLLRTHPIGGERVALVAGLILRLDVRSLAHELGAICTDDAVPPSNRAAIAWVLQRADVDAGVPTERLPALAEAGLLGCALVSDPSEVAPLVAALLASSDVDRDAVIGRLDAWRVPAAAPGALVYGEALRSTACAPAHARILETLERDPLSDALVRDAREQGALDPDLADTFLERAPAERLPASGRAWVGNVCTGCGGREVHLIWSCGANQLQASLHLSADRSGDGVLLPLLPRRIADEMVLEYEQDEDLVEIDLGSVVTTAGPVTGDLEVDVRILWLLRRLEPSPEGLTEVLLRKWAVVEGQLGAKVEILDASDDIETLEEAVDLVCDAFDAQLLSPGHPPMWEPLVAAVIRRLERPALRWGEVVPPVYGYAWSAIVDAAEQAEEDFGLLPGVGALIERVGDGMTWREALATFCVERSEDDDEPVEALAGLVVQFADIFARLEASPVDVARALRAPDTLATDIAAHLRIAPEAPLAAYADTAYSEFEEE